MNLKKTYINKRVLLEKIEYAEIRKLKIFIMKSFEIGNSL